MSEPKVKVIAMYLPQYHEIPENSLFWGEGFTDWVSVKKATPLFEGHKQPQEPLNDYYYDLSKKDSISWQVEIAKKYGVYGFGIYHYWFSNDKQLLTKPAEIILENKDLSIPFFLAWDNANWRRTWSKFRGNAWTPLVDEENKDKTKGQSSILVEYILGGKEDWKQHFMYLLEYFKDDRYIKVDGKPLFMIFNYSQQIGEMQVYWDELARENGFEGVKIVYKKSPLNNLPAGTDNFSYEPINSGWGDGWKIWGFKALSLLNLVKYIGPLKYSYDKVWKKLIRNASKRKESYEWQGAFVSYDDTPRRGKQGRIVMDATPQKFAKYLKEYINVIKEQGKEYIFLTAWNEWGEGAMLEPTKENGFEYLEALEEAVNEQ